MNKEVTTFILGLKTFFLQFRCLRASEDINAGDTIFEQYPLSRGLSCTPYSNHPVCLGCYQFLEGNPSSRICTECGWPLCSVACETSPEHLPECQMFSAKNVKMCSDNFNYNDTEPMYDIIGPLRLLWLRQYRPDKWHIFWSMMSHVEQWMQSRNWVESHQSSIKYIINVLKLGKNNTIL